MTVRYDNAIKHDCNNNDDRPSVYNKYNVKLTQDRCPLITYTYTTEK